MIIIDGNEYLDSIVGKMSPTKYLDMLNIKYDIFSCTKDLFYDTIAKKIPKEILDLDFIMFRVDFNANYICVYLFSAEYTKEKIFKMFDTVENMKAFL